jgi:hypothetical protein
VTFAEMEAGLRARLKALPPAARAELLHVLRLPDLERAERTGKFWSYPQSRAFAELLIDCEEDRTLPAVLAPCPLVVGMRTDVLACAVETTLVHVSRLLSSKSARAATCVRAHARLASGKVEGAVALARPFPR